MSAAEVEMGFWPALSGRQAAAGPQAALVRLVTQAKTEKVAF